MAALTTILPYVLAELPSAPSSLVLQTAAKVVDQFCRATTCWVVEEVFSLNAGVPDYQLTPPTDAKLATVLTVTLPSGQLIPTTRDLLFQAAPAWQQDTGSPDSFYVALPASVGMYPSPDDASAGKSLTVRASWTTQATATTWDDYLMERYIHAIAAGVKGAMMSMVGQPWSNPDGAAYLVEFQNHIRDNRIDVFTGMQVRNVAVRKPRFV